MKTLLIPTDFNVNMLNCIPYLLQRHYPHQVNIILVHMMKITDNVQELLMLSKRSVERQHISPDFYNACAALKRQYPGLLNNLRMEFFYGSTLAIFKNFLEVNQVDSIVMLENYNYSMLHKNSIEPQLMVSRSNINVIKVDNTEYFNMPYIREKLEEAV